MREAMAILEKSPLFVRWVDALPFSSGWKPMAEALVTTYTCPKCGGTATFWREAHPDTGMDAMELWCRACRHHAEDGEGFIKGPSRDDGQPDLDQRLAAEPTTMGKLCVSLGIAGPTKDRLVAQAGESVTWEAVARGRLDEGVVLTLGTEAETFRAFDTMHRAMNDGTPMPWTGHDPVESAELPFTCACEDKGSLTKGDLAKLDAMDANKNWPDKAEGGKAFVVLWADGRGVARFPTKAAVRAWAKKTGKWADITWIRYQDPEYKGKKLRESGNAFCFLLCEHR
jgi:hypothetical protein